VSARHPIERSPLDLALQRQQLRSERQRVASFALLLALLLPIPLILQSVPDLIDESLRQKMAAAVLPFMIVAGGFLTYELVVWVWLSRLIRTDRLKPRGFGYLNAFVEVSLPTVSILVGATFLGGLAILAGVLPFVYFLFLCLAALSLDFRLCVFAGGVACLQFLIVSLSLLGLDSGTEVAASPLLAMLHSPHQYVLKSLFLLLGGVISGYVATQIKRQFAIGLQTLQERDQAVSIFGQHVSPQVAELLLKQPMDAVGQERLVCVMFLDIRDFSRIAAERSPAEVMDYLNTIFSFMIPVINQHHGIINKFLGDGFMAVFGAPLDDVHPCANAVAASRVILAQVERMNQEAKIPTTRLGIGLHLGVALTGNVGGGDRKEYTVIGDVVNLAARIEQATKTYQAQLLVSEEVFKTLENTTAEDLGPVELKGQPKPTRLFKLL
jgi:adenylate cyclase